MTPTPFERAIRLAGIVSAIGCALILFSFGTLAVAVCFQPESNGVNPWFATLGIVAMLLCTVAGIYLTRKSIVAPISEIARRVPEVACIVAYFISVSVLFAPAVRDIARGNVYLDFSRTFAPFLIAWIVYRLLRFYIEPYFTKKKT